MTFDEWWKKETDDNENNVDDWKGFCKTAFEAGQKEVKQLGERCNQLLKDKGELTDKIEKMKCCENCKYNSYWGDELHCNYGLKEALQEDKLVECNKMDKWEIKE